MNKFFPFLILALLGCAHSTIIPFQSGNASKPYPPTDPSSVGIYRSQNPFPSFIELGAITFRTSRIDLETMYQQLREDSAKCGADAVVDVKISKETHTESSTEQQCIPRTVCDGGGLCRTENDCHFEPVMKDVTTFLIAGTMIRRKL